MAKILLDKYYTSPDLAKYIVDKTKLIIGEENITEYIEPSAGAGVFLDYLNKPYLAYDIEPEDNKGRIVKCDFLELDLEYKKGRCVIGNPPYGEKNTLSVKFFNKAIEFADYISFILPISQYKNNQQMYKFDLIHSENLGIHTYSNRQIYCCFNIYKIPLNGLNNKIKYKLNDMEIIESRFGNRIPNNYDLRLLAWGTGINGLKLGGILNKTHKQYSKEFYIKINNNNIKNKIINIFRETDWCKEYPMTATPNLLQWQVYKYIKEQIPEIN